MKGERNRERKMEKKKILGDFVLELRAYCVDLVCVWKSSIRIGRMRASPLFFPLFLSFHRYDRKFIESGQRLVCTYLDEDGFGMRSDRYWQFFFQNLQLKKNFPWIPECQGVRVKKIIFFRIVFWRSMNWSFLAYFGCFDSNFEIFRPFFKL